MVNLKALAAKYFYKDRARVYRQEGLQGGWNSGGLSLIYEEVPCHLAQYGKELSAYRDDRAQQVTINLRLDCAPEFDILENDTVEVVTAQGEAFKLVAGVSKKYISHQEIGMRRRKEAREK